MKHETIITTFMKENIQETSVCFLSIVPVVDNLEEFYYVLNMKRTHKKYSDMNI